jgi:polyisoprenoid-binding protein YceI
MTTATVFNPTDTSSLAGTRWELDPVHTTVEFAVKHLMITTVRGRFDKFTGSAYVDPDHPDTPQVEVTIDAASIDTREPRRDEHLRSPDFLHAAEHPTITFRGRRVEGDITGGFRLVGDLTIRGITREVALKAKFEGRTQDPWGGERAGFSATAKLNRHDFNLRWNVALETGGVLVGDEVRLSIDAQLVRQAEAKAA